MEPFIAHDPSALKSATTLEPEPTCYKMRTSVIDQIRTLAAQIEAPCVEYSTDPLAMAQAVIEDQRKRANMIARLLPGDF